jgi:hypothetical protein
MTAVDGPIHWSATAAVANSAAGVFLLGSNVCETCADLAVGDVPELPAWIPTDGCRVTCAADANAIVVAIVGAHRREVVLLRGDEVVSWRSFHDDTRGSCTAIAAARRWGRDYSIVAMATRSEPHIGGPDNTVWIRNETRLEVGPPSACVTVPFGEADEILDAVSLAVDDGGPYPSVVQEGGGAHLGAADIRDAAPDADADNANIGAA